MISVIIPAYNEEKYITGCLQAVFSQKNSPDFEVIVVDNASTDRTAEVVRLDFPAVQLIREPKKAVTWARNRGASQALGEILFFLDADVVLPPGYLGRLLAKFQKDKKLILASGPYIYALNSNLFIRLAVSFLYRFLISPAEYFFNRFLNLSSSLNAGNFAVLKESFVRAGGFNENIAFFGDEADLARRLRKFGKTRFFLDLAVATSARRFKKEGFLKACLKYGLNIIWPILFGKPFHKEYIDVR
jgi:glycosyltransferase involved in cell wall biosynthesis